jgi:hypothetical protein
VWALGNGGQAELSPELNPLVAGILAQLAPANILFFNTPNHL